MTRPSLTARRTAVRHRAAFAGAVVSVAALPQGLELERLSPSTLLHHPEEGHVAVEKKGNVFLLGGVSSLLWELCRRASGRWSLSS